jgi:putative hydrolase of the HAD superfamily
MNPVRISFRSGTEIRAAVFDLDDTLYLERDYVLSGFRHIARLAAPAAARSATELFRFLRMTVEEWQSRGNNLDLLLERYPALRQSWTVEMLVQEYRTHPPVIHFLRGMESLLGDLRRQGAHLAIITDGPPDSQRRKLDALHLPAMVDKTVVTEEYGPAWRKPRPLSFGMVMRQFGCRPDECVYVGDNPARDFEAPRTLGWNTVRLRVRGQLHASVEPLSPDAAPAVECQTVGELRAFLLGRFKARPGAEHTPTGHDREHQTV